MKNFQRKFANILLVLAIASIAHGLWLVFTNVEIAFDPWLVLILLGATIGTGLAIALIVNFKPKLEFALTVFTLVISCYAGIFVLELTGRNLFNIFETKVVRNVVAQTVAVARQDGFVSPRPVDERSTSQIFSDLQKHGFDPNFLYASPQLLPVIANGSLPKFLPLSSRSNTVTIFCNEGDQREFPIIRTDRYGFNNDDVVHAWSADKILIVGDSFAQGSCVHQEQSVAGVLRRNGFPAISAGIGGFGPIMALASLKEYGEPLKPKTVLWFYFDGNDVSDLQEKGLRSRFLLRYLRDGFSQNLIARQQEVDTFWRSGQFGEVLKAFSEDPKAQAAWTNTLTENLPLVRELTGFDDLKSLTDDESLLRVFTKVIEIAKRRVEAWGGKLYFVMIPNKDDYHGRVPKFRFPILSNIKKLGVPIIDVDAVIRATGDPLNYYPVRDQWGHFNAAGYRLFAHQVIAALAGQGGENETAAPVKSVPETPAPTAQPTVQTPDAKQAAALPPAPAQKPTGDVRLEYKSYGQTAALIPVDISRARNTDGASILGYGFVPKSEKGVLKVRVSVNAFAPTDNELVLATFLTGRDAPIDLARKKIGAAERVFLDTEFTVPFESRAQITFDIRVGPAKKGTIYINGDSAAAQPVPTTPYLSIEETADATHSIQTRKAALPGVHRWGRFWRQQYPAHMVVSGATAALPKTLPPDHELALLGFEFKPKPGVDGLTARVAMNAYSETPNELVVGLYRGQELALVDTASAEMKAGQVTYLIKTFDLGAAKSTENLRVVVGAGKPGKIFVNGDGKGGHQKVAFYPVLTVSESNLGRNGSSATEHFPKDDGSYGFAKSQNLVNPHSDPSPAGRREVSCSTALAGDDTGVFVTFGQSQAANSGDVKFQPTKDVVNFNFLDSKCYVAADPLLGASNLNGSIWSRLGEELVNSGKFKRIVVVPIAVGGTFLSEWMPGGHRHRRLSLALQRLHRANAKVTAFLWQQGEAEASLTDMTADAYKSGFLEMLSSIREQGFKAPVFVAVSTYCGMGEARNKDNIRRALKELSAENRDIFPGPDTDEIAHEHRHDGCHLGGAGQDTAAQAWKDAILAR